MSHYTPLPPYDQVDEQGDGRVWIDARGGVFAQENSKGSFGPLVLVDGVELSRRGFGTDAVVRIDQESRARGGSGILGPALGRLPLP